MRCGATIEYDMVDKGAISRIAARRHALVGEAKIGIGGTTVIQFGPNRISAFGEPTIPITEHRKSVGSVGGGIDPFFQYRHLSQESSTRLRPVALEAT